MLEAFPLMWLRVYYILRCYHQEENLVSLETIKEWLLLLSTSPLRQAAGPFWYWGDRGPGPVDFRFAPGNSI